MTKSQPSESERIRLVTQRERTQRSERREWSDESSPGRWRSVRRRRTRHGGRKKRCSTSPFGLHEHNSCHSLLGPVSWHGCHANGQHIDLTIAYTFFDEKKEEMSISTREVDDMRQRKQKKKKCFGGSVELRNTGSFLSAIFSGKTQFPIPTNALRLAEQGSPRVRLTGVKEERS